jgi:ferredoxin
MRETSMRVQADFDLCEANALCVGIAPETFELDDDDYLQILDDHVTPENESRIRQAVASCPRNALGVVEN